MTWRVRYQPYDLPADWKDDWVVREFNTKADAMLWADIARSRPGDYRVEVYEQDDE